MKNLPPYKFSPVTEIIIASTRNADEIRKSFYDMVAHYVENHEEFRDILTQTKEAIESADELTEPQRSALRQIYKVLNEDIEADAYFTFSEELLLDDYRKIYRQIRDRHSLDVVKENRPVEVTFYSLINGVDENDCVIYNKLGVKKLTVKAQEFIIQYQMLYN